MFLAISRHTKTSATVEITDDTGTPHYQIVANRYKPADVQLLVSITKWQLPEVLAALNKVCDNPDTVETHEIDISADALDAQLRALIPAQVEPATDTPPDNANAVVFYLREVTQTRAHGVSFHEANASDGLRNALASAMQNPHIREPLVEWNGREELCCLDIDYHNSEVPPTRDHVQAIFDSIKPKPLAFHFSHSGGAKLYYVRSGEYSALEIASVAGLAWVTADCAATFDLTSSTRHPCYARSRDDKPAPHSTLDSVQWAYGNADMSVLRRVLLGEVSYDDVAEYMTERGYTIGAVLPHTQCPIQPTDDTKANVFVGEAGIYCHRCAAKGLGGKTPGFVPFAALVGTVDTRVSLMVRNFVHLEHARIVMKNVFPMLPDKVVPSIYRALLKIVHNPEDIRIHLAMHNGKGFVRSNGQWVTADGSTVLTESKKQFVDSLPATKVMSATKDNEPKLVGDASRVVSFMNTGTLEDFGYADVSFIRGCKIYGQFLEYPRQEVIQVVTRREFANAVPTYAPRHKRMPSADAWAHLDSVFPGIDKNYVKLLIAAKGASEGRLAQCPFLLVAGVSGAGKSSTVHIAAGLCGDKADEPIFHPHVDRFRQSLMDGARNSGFICVNEVFKMADRARLGYTQALDPMLSLTEDSRSHVLYVGSVPFGRLPVFVLTDIDIPPEVEQDIQLARRFTFYRLPTQNHWQDSIVSHGMRLHEFRLQSYDCNCAADSIISEVIDEFFRTPTPLHVIAKALSAGTLETYSGERERTADMMSKFYALVCDAPKLSGSHAQRYNPEWGWKLIDRATVSPLVELWNELCDGVAPNLWCKSRALSSHDWRAIARVEFPVMCEMKANKTGSYVYIRFRSTESPRKPRWVNGRVG